LPLALAIGSTFTPGTIRAWLLVAAVVAAVLTFHKTEYAGQNLKKTVPVGIGFLGIALVVFFIGRAMDTPAKAVQVAQVTTKDKPPVSAPAVPPIPTTAQPATSAKQHRKSNHAPVPNPGVKQPAIGNDNTLVNVPVPPALGNGNTIIGPTDSNGNTIYNKGGTAIGAGATADPTSIAIGAGAHACGNVVTPPPVITQGPCSIAQIGGNGNQAAGGNCGVSEPEIQVTALGLPNLPEGTLYKTQARMTINSDVPIPSLYLRVDGSIARMQVAQQRAGMQTTGFSGVRDDFAFVTVMNAYGDYIVTVLSKVPLDRFNLTYNIEGLGKKK
jgi:hypothetical protein